MKRYVPEKLRCFSVNSAAGRFADHGERDVRQVMFRPESMRQPGDAPIREDMGLLLVTLGCGCVKKFGVDDAYIDSTLRMVAVGGYVNPRNELVRSWREVPDDAR